MNFLLPLLAEWGVPKAVRKPLQWAILIGPFIAVFFSVKALYEASVINDHEKDRIVEAVPAYSNAAEQRAADTITGIIANKDRVEAIETAAASEAAKPVEQRAKLPPTTQAFNCVRVRQAYTARELAKMAAYQEHCR